MVYLVGGGPGDPKLITLKGVECLERADVVIYDLLISDALLGTVRRTVRESTVENDRENSENARMRLTLSCSEKPRTARQSFGSKAAILSFLGAAVRRCSPSLRRGSTLRLYPALPPQSRHRHMQVFRSPIETCIVCRICYWTFGIVRTRFTDRMGAIGNGCRYTRGLHGYRAPRPNCCPTDKTRTFPRYSCDARPLGHDTSTKNPRRGTRRHI